MRSLEGHMSMQVCASCSGARRSVAKREVIRRAHDAGVRPVHPASIFIERESDFAQQGRQKERAAPFAECGGGNE